MHILLTRILSAICTVHAYAHITPILLVTLLNNLQTWFSIHWWDTLWLGLLDKQLWESSCTSSWEPMFLWEPNALLYNRSFTILNQFLWPHPVSRRSVSSTEIALAEIISYGEWSFWYVAGFDWLIICLGFVHICL